MTSDSPLLVHIVNASSQSKEVMGASEREVGNHLEERVLTFCLRVGREWVYGTTHTQARLWITHNIRRILPQFKSKTKLTCRWRDSRVPGVNITVHDGLISIRTKATLSSPTTRSVTSSLAWYSVFSTYVNTDGFKLFGDSTDPVKTLQLRRSEVHFTPFLRQSSVVL